MGSSLIPGIPGIPLELVWVWRNSGNSGNSAGAGLSLVYFEKFRESRWSRIGFCLVVGIPRIALERDWFWPIRGIPGIPLEQDGVWPNSGHSEDFAGARLDFRGPRVWVSGRFVWGSGGLEVWGWFLSHADALRTVVFEMKGTILSDFHGHDALKPWSAVI